MLKKIEIKEIPLKDLEVADTNIRKQDPNPSIDELAKSMNKVGQTDLIYVFPKGNKYMILKGQRRFYAAKKLMESGKPVYSLTAVVLPSDLKEDDQLIASWTEDEHQLKVSQIDTSKVIDRLLKLGRTKEEIKEISGLSEEQYLFQLSLLGSNEPETLKEREKENTSTPAQTISKESLKGKELVPTITPTGKIEDKFHGLTTLQRSEVMARQKEHPEKSLDDIISETKDHFSASWEVGGLYILTPIIDGFKSLANEKGTNFRYEMQKFINENAKEYLEKKGHKIVL